LRRQRSIWSAVTWARLLAAAAATAGVWIAAGPYLAVGASRPELLTAGGIATGVALVCCALGVVALSRGRQGMARLAGLVVLVLTIAGTLVHQPAIVATPPGLLLWELIARHGWIDYASAQILMVCGVGLFIPLRSSSPRLRDASAAFVAAVLLAGGTARASGLIAGAGLMWEPFAGMPAPFAFAAIALGGALLLIRRGASLLGADVAGWRQVPVTVTIAIAALSCVLWRSLSMERARGASPMEHRDVVALTAEIRAAVAEHANILKRLAYQPAKNTVDWARVAHAQIDNVPAFAAIAWVTPTLDTRIEMDHDALRRGLVDLKQMPAGRVALRAAKASGAVTVSRPVDLEVQGDACLIIVPTPATAPEEGAVVGLVRYHELFASLPSVRRAGVEVADNTTPLYRAGPERPATDAPAWMPLSVPGAPEWRLRAWRGGSRLVPADTPLPEIVLGVGLLLSLVAGLGAHFVDEGGRRT
jgi:hypothetical protein